MPEGELVDAPLTHNVITPAKDASSGALAQPHRGPTAFMNSLDHLRRILFGERPSREQVGNLDAMRQVVLPHKEGEQIPDPSLAVWLLMTKWVEKLEYARGHEAINLIDRLYQKISGNDAANFKKEFPSLTRRLRRSFRNRNVEDPDWRLSRSAVLTKRIDEFLAEHGFPVQASSSE